MTENESHSAAVTESESHSAAVKRIQAQLAERWPALFNPKKPAPLAIGIYDALAEAMPDVPGPLLRRVMAGWCNRPRYFAALKAGAARQGLDGPQGEVTAEQAAAAADMYQAAQARYREQTEAKRKAEEAAKEASRRKQEKLKAKAEAEAAKAKAKEEARAFQEARIKAKEEAKAQPAAQPAPPPSPKPAAAKPAGPVVIVKKRRGIPGPSDA